MNTNKLYRTNYLTAVDYCNNYRILLNNIHEIDPDFIDPTEDPDDEENPEIYQYFITDCSDDDVKFLKEHFGLLFSYSNVLEHYILCVDHYGTSWEYVGCDTDLPQAKRKI